MAVLVLPVVLLTSALNPTGGVVIARGVAKERLTRWRCCWPVVLLRALAPWRCCVPWCCRSAWTPLAVLLKPVVLLRSAWTPLAVLLLPVVLLKSA